MSNGNNQLDILDLLAILSFIIGYNNLIENREQSEYNDINSANDKQAKYLLNEINKKFDKLTQDIEYINDKLDRMR